MNKVLHNAFFLDRDGVINVDHGYVNESDNFEFIDGVFEACQSILQHGYKIVVVTNQAGIGRGFYTEQQFHQLTHWMIEQFARHQVDISDVQFCPHHAESGIGDYQRECYNRKPNPGMIFAAAEKLGIDLSRSVLVGDKTSDIDAARNAGIPNRFLVGSCFSQEQDFFHCVDLRDAVERFFAQPPA